MDRESKRRRFLGAFGAGAVALTAGCTNALDGDDSDGTDTETDDDADGTDDAEAPSDFDGGAVVFVYDDGPIEDYEQAFPVHREFDAPASTGVVTEWVGREDGDAEWMAVEHLEELADAGWEVMGHTTAHTALKAYELVEDTEPDDTRIYPEARTHGFHRGYDVEITDGENRIRRTVTDSDRDDIGGYLEFDEPVHESFAAGETVERYPEDLMHEFLGDCKQKLESWGFEVDTLLAPYDDCDEWAIEVASEYYDGIANVNPGSMINEVDDFDPFDTHHDSFVQFTTAESVENQLDRIAEQEAIGILGAQTFDEDVTEERIRETLERVDDRDLEVITFREAISSVASGSD